MTTKETSKKPFVDLTPEEILDRVKLDALTNADLVDVVYLRGFLGCLDTLQTLFTRQKGERKKV